MCVYTEIVLAVLMFPTELLMMLLMFLTELALTVLTVLPEPVSYLTVLVFLTELLV
jgi:hypothetical protein